MSCQDFTEHLIEGAPLSDADRVHAKRCPPCGSLLTVDRALTALPSEAVAIEPCASLRQALASDHAPTRTMSPWTRVLVPACVAVAMAAVVMLVRPRPDLALASGPLFWLAAAAWISLVVGGMRMLVARGRMGLGVPALYRWSYIGVAIVAFEVLSILVNPGDAHSIARVGAHTWWRHWTCAPAGSLAALVVAFPAFALLRRSAVVAPEAAGALAGLVAGVASVLSMQMACGFADSLHYATIHLVPVVLAVIIGSFVGRRVLSP